MIIVISSLRYILFFYIYFFYEHTLSTTGYIIEAYLAQLLFEAPLFFPLSFYFDNKEKKILTADQRIMFGLETGACE